jgi:hypothetical protein
MDYSDKKNIILAEINHFYPLFLKKAEQIIDKKIAPEPQDPMELTSEVFFSILNKMDSSIYIDRIYNMIENQNFYSYLNRSIFLNARSKRAPFLFEKLKLRNRIILVEGINHKPDIEYDDSNDELLLFIDTLLSPPKAIQVFGPHWKYYVNLLDDYCKDPDATHESIAKSYGLHKSSISYSFKQLRKIIQNEVAQNYHPKN